MLLNAVAYLGSLRTLGTWYVLGQGVTLMSDSSVRFERVGRLRQTRLSKILSLTRGSILESLVSRCDGRHIELSGLPVQTEPTV